MKGKKIIVSIGFMLAIVILVFVFFNRSGEKEVKVKETEKLEENLMALIEERAQKVQVPPKDAYIDKVWKKTPGRNGLKVNVKKSYENMKKAKEFDESLMVYEQIAPEITIKDLAGAPIYRGHPDKNMVALMINVSWGTEHIPAILETLNKHGVKATFFIEGKWAKENKDTLEMIYEEEHLIGNHAYNHPDMAKMSFEQSYDQIDRTNKIIESIIDVKVEWFAPPSGSFNDHVIKAADDLDMETILWTVDTIDWQNPSVSVMINRVMKDIHKGAMILMHPTVPVAEGLDTLIEDIKAEAYRIGTVEHLLSDTR